MNRKFEITFILNKNTFVTFVQTFVLLLWNNLMYHWKIKVYTFFSNK